MDVRSEQRRLRRLDDALFSERVRVVKNDRHDLKIRVPVLTLSG